MLVSFRKESTTMDGAAARPTLVENINSAFSRENVEISVARLQQISKSRREDFLSISRKLGILGDMDDRRFRRYRKNITLPRLIQQILTTTHHTALFANPPIPMHIEINDATP